MAAKKTLTADIPMTRPLGARLVVENIRTFEYRPRRIETGFAVDFETAARTTQGVCWNMAETGIRAEFASPVRIDQSGQLTLYHSGRVLRLAAQVTHVNGRQAGLIFQFQNTEERDQAADFARLCRPLGCEPVP